MIFGTGIMQKRILFPAIFGILIVGGNAFLAQGKTPASPLLRSPVVVELFTSQGCSSCPPADALIGRLAEEPGIIAISRPVTYWDCLGWHDTLAREANTALQRSYVARGIGGEVFTPQVVVQGQASAVGSDERAIHRLVANAAGIANASITARAGDHGGLSLLLDGVSGIATEVKLVTLRRKVAVRIGNGENSGRSIVYTNVVSRERAIGTWRGGAQQFAMPANRMATAGGEQTAVIVQQRGGGPIIGALMLP